MWRDLQILLVTEAHQAEEKRQLKAMNLEIFHTFWQEHKCRLFQELREKHAAIRNVYKKKDSV